MSANPKVILVTGASRGIGRAVARYLISHQHKVVLMSRTAAPLEELKAAATRPEDVEIAAGDVVDSAVAQRAVKVAIDAFGGLDGLVVNHGTMGEVQRVDVGSMQGWRDTFEVNVISCVNLIQHALPALRKSKGRIIFTSSGAAISGYAAWGAYGASKAAINHLTLTLQAEEPDVTTVAVRPGIVDSDMQRDIREKYASVMDDHKVKRFKDAHEQGTLLKPEQPGHVIARLAINAEKALSGKFVSWDSDDLEAYRN